MSVHEVLQARVFAHPLTVVDHLLDPVCIAGLNAQPSYREPGPPTARDPPAKIRSNKRS